MSEEAKKKEDEGTLESTETNSRKFGEAERARSHGTMVRLLRRRRMKTRTRPMALVPMRVARATVRCSASRSSAGTTAGDSHTSAYSGRRPKTSAPRLVFVPSARHCSTLKLSRSSSSVVRAAAGACVHRYSATATISRAFLSASLSVSSFVSIESLIHLLLLLWMIALFFFVIVFRCFFFFWKRKDVMKKPSQKHLSHDLTTFYQTSRCDGSS